MTDLSLFRVYEPHELGPDGYPLVWHSNVVNPPGRSRLDGKGKPLAGPYEGERAGACDQGVRDVLDRLGSAACPIDFMAGVKHIVRADAGHRCVRCGHPYVVGQSGTWAAAAPASHEKSNLLALFEDGQATDAELERQIRERPPLWSPCDERCTHGGPLRWMANDDGVWLPHGDRELQADGHNAGMFLTSDARKRVEAAWRILTVHHLNGRKHDLRWWNLAALCQRCHLHIQKKVQMERVYPFEHTPWFKPYAAGWYSYAYLGESLTREQAMERLDELLALERLDVHPPTRVT